MVEVGTPFNEYKIFYWLSKYKFQFLWSEDGHVSVITLGEDVQSVYRNFA